MGKITYTKQGDYYLPDIVLPEQPEVTLGRYANMRRKYLKEHHRVIYYNYLTSCTLVEHLHEVEMRAIEMEENLTKQMMADEGITEKLKAEDMMLWVQKMNNLRSRVREMVMTEVIYA